MAIILTTHVESQVTTVAPASQMPTSPPSSVLKPPTQTGEPATESTSNGTMKMPATPPTKPSKA